MYKSQGLSGFRSVLVLCVRICWHFQVECQIGSFGFNFAGWENEESQAQQGSNAARSEQVTLRIKRGRFRRCVYHR